MIYWFGSSTFAPAAIALGLFCHISSVSLGLCFGLGAIIIFGPGLKLGIQIILECTAEQL